MRRITFILVLGLLAAGMTGSMAATAASGGDNGDVPVASAPASGTAISARAALTADAKSYAKDFSTTVPVARQRLAEQGALGRVLNRLEKQFPQTYAGGWIEHAPEFRAVARFTGTVPSAADAIVGSRDVVLRGGASSSLTALQARADRVHADLRAAKEREIVTAVDVRRGTIEVSLPRRADRRALPDSLTGNGVRLHYTEGSVSGSQHTYGGAMTPGTSGGYCTTGFVVAHNGTWGFVTAGHCGDGRNYQQPEDGLTYAAPFQGEHRGTYGDLQWHTTGHNEYAEFYTTNTGRRGVTGYDADWSVGAYRCKYGRTSGYGCSTIYNSNVNISFDGFTHRLVAMNDYITLGGDSGGPWFIVNSAVGVHSGWGNVGGAQRSTFTKITYIDEALGLALGVQG